MPSPNYDLNFDPYDVARTVSITDNATIALHRIPKGNINRLYRLIVKLDGTAAADYAIQLGVPPEGTDAITQESDLKWYEEVTISSNDTVRESVDVGEPVLRVQVTGTGGSADEATISVTKSRP